MHAINKVQIEYVFIKVLPSNLFLIEREELVISRLRNEI